jgi:hypothetical protein
MAVVCLREALRLMGGDDSRKDVPRKDLPGDLGGGETAWSGGRDQAQREDQDKKHQSSSELPVTMSQTDEADTCP